MFRSLVVLHHAGVDVRVLIDAEQHAFHPASDQRTARDCHTAPSEPTPVGSVTQRAIHARRRHFQPIRFHDQTTAVEHRLDRA